MVRQLSVKIRMHGKTLQVDGATLKATEMKEQAGGGLTRVSQDIERDRIRVFRAANNPRGCNVWQHRQCGKVVVKGSNTGASQRISPDSPVPSLPHRSPVPVTSPPTQPETIDELSAYDPASPGSPALSDQPRIFRLGAPQSAIYHPRAHEIFAIDITQSAYLEPSNRSPVIISEETPDRITVGVRVCRDRQGCVDAVESWSMGFSSPVYPATAAIYQSQPFLGSLGLG